MISEIHISTDTSNNSSSLLKELIPDNISIVEPKLPFKSVTFYLSTWYPKEPLYVTLNKELETEEYSPELPELPPLLLVTPKMELNLE